MYSCVVMGVIIHMLVYMGVPMTRFILSNSTATIYGQDSSDRVAPIISDKFTTQTLDGNSWEMISEILMQLII